MDVESTKLASAKRFGDNAAKYAASKGHGDAESLHSLVEFVQPKPTDLFLDVATGAGHTGLAFAPYVKEVVAFDLSQGMLDQTLKTAHERGLENVRSELGDAENMPFENGRFDIVACRIAAHHFPNQPKFFAESARVLKPKGKLLFVDNYGRGSPETARQVEEIERLRDWTHYRTWTLDELRNQITQAGFEIVCEETGYYDEAGPIDFDDWCSRIGTPDEERAELRIRFGSASADLVAALKIQTVDGKIQFSLPKVTILAIKR